MAELDILQQYDKKLEKVNSIIQKIAAETKNITPMLPADYALFDEFFDKEERHTYGNSWIYVTQGTYGIGPEKLGYKYSDGENLCTMAIFPKIEQPDIIMLYWIRPLGPGIMPIIAKLAEEIKQKYGICSYVKKLFPDQYEYLLQHGFRSAKEFPWHSSAHSEDDTYPELIFDREKTLRAIQDAPKRSSLGSSMRNVSSLKRKNIIESTSLGFGQKAWELIKNYFKNYEEISAKPNVSNPFDYYNMIHCDYSGLASVERKIIHANGEMQGFYVIVRNERRDFVNPYCSIMMRQKYKHLADYFFSTLFFDETAKYINLGGSEDKGMHKFKHKFQPIENNIMYWAVNYL